MIAGHRVICYHFGTGKLLCLCPIRKAGRMSRGACEHDGGGGVASKIFDLDL